MSGTFRTVPRHGGDIVQAAQAYALAPEQIIDFSASINPLGFPSSVAETVQAALKEVVHYPDPEATQLREALAAYHGVPPETILAGNGTAELIHLIATAFRPRVALIYAPAFSEYQRSVETARGRVVFETSQEPEGFTVNCAPGVLRHRLALVDLVFLGNPNNPTGRLTTSSELLSLLDLCRKRRVRLILDEVFMDFVDRPDEVSLITTAAHEESLIVLRSFTKLFAIPGLRLGYAIAHPNTVKRLVAAQPPWMVNTLAQAVGVSCLKETAFIATARQYLAQAKAQLFKELSAIPSVKPYPPAANFILCQLTDRAITAQALTEALGRRGLLIRCCDNVTGFAPGRFVRMAVRTKEENQILLRTLREVLSNGG